MALDDQLVLIKNVTVSINVRFCVNLFKDQRKAEEKCTLTASSIYTKILVRTNSMCVRVSWCLLFVRPSEVSVILSFTERISHFN